MGVMVNTIICDMFSLRDRGLYLAITSIVWAVGSAVGPVLGGVFTTRLALVSNSLCSLSRDYTLTNHLSLEHSWRWCFWINCKCFTMPFAYKTHMVHNPRFV